MFLFRACYILSITLGLSFIVSFCQRHTLIYTLFMLVSNFNTVFENLGISNTVYYMSICDKIHELGLYSIYLNLQFYYMF